MIKMFDKIADIFVRWVFGDNEWEEKEEEEDNWEEEEILYRGEDEH
jgi:hypothetical protein